jgi:hypothetical protein
MVLIRAVIDQLRNKRVIIPPLSVIERLCAEAITRADRRLYRKLTGGLSEVQRTALDDVLGVMRFGWRCMGLRVAAVQGLRGLPNTHRCLWRTREVPRIACRGSGKLRAVLEGAT